jgi:hypothetical protein
VKAAYVCLVASVLSGCAAQSRPSVNGRPYYGADPNFLMLKRMADTGLMPISISCQMPRSGPAAKSPEGNQATLRWTKAPKAHLGWSIIVGESAGAQAERAAAKAKGFRKVSTDSFYQSVARKRMKCELWSAQ